MELNLPSESKEFLTASVFAGMLVGGLICGVIADKWGRKKCLLYSTGINAIAGLLSASTPTIGWLIFFRVVAGMGIGGSIPTVFTLGSNVNDSTSSLLLLYQPCHVSPLTLFHFTSPHLESTPSPPPPPTHVPCILLTLSLFW